MEALTATTARTYADALTAKDFATVAGMFAGDVVWHQPGAHQFAGTYRGAAAVGEHLGALMAASQGTFALSVTGEPMINGDLAAMQVEFGAQREAPQCRWPASTSSGSRATGSPRCGSSRPISRQRTSSGALSTRPDLVALIPRLRKAPGVTPARLRK